MEPNLEKDVKEFQEQLAQINVKEREQEILNLLQIIEEINQKEEILNQLIDIRNELQELENQLRHILKRNRGYDLIEYEVKLSDKYRRFHSTKLQKKIKKLAEFLVALDAKRKISFWKKFALFLSFGKTMKQLEYEGVSLHLILEKYYLEKLIEERKKKFENENFEGLKSYIKNLYLEKYIPISKQILKQVLKKNVDEKLIEKILKEIEIGKTEEPTEQNRTPILKRTKNDLLQLYPIVLTTVDSFISNYGSYFEENKKIDYVIIDEASQCDILSGLPLLYLAQNIVIVGDQKQLSAITNLKKQDLKNSVEEIYDYTKENFLSTVSKTMKPVSQMLLEHYRCDYNIINYCNKFFYNNQLKIYKDRTKESMILIDNDKGKYVESDKNGFCNQREIKTIDAQIEQNIEGKFVITPFKKQAKILKENYGKNQCGTIHTFQGRGEDEVYFSSVLNDTEACKSHLLGPNNLFKQELINVAVSRAKEKFVLVTDTKFFKKYNEDMKNLIEYLEIYGEKIPDKTVCIFDYLYEKIPSYQTIIPDIQNPYEEKIYHLLLHYLQKKKGHYKLKVKLLLAMFVTDEKYLNKNEKIKQFILHDSHLDFALYTDSINKPVLAIEVDGKHHEEEKQKQRDKMKEEILEYMNIPLLRISSKTTLEEAELEREIEKKLDLS